jgi:predicted dehydrogenase
MTQPLRVGIAGAGAVVRELHGPAFAACPDADLVALASRDERRAQALAATVGAPRTERTVEELVVAPDIDAVVICTPPHTHRELAERAVSAGKHVLLEKPVAHTLRDTEALGALARSAPVVVELVRNERFMELHRAARAVLDGGDLGEPRAIVQFTAITGPEDWTQGSTWPRDRSRSGGGALLDLGVHKADLAMWLTGAPIVDAGSAALDRAEPGAVESAGAVALRLEGGAVATVAASWRGPADAMSLLVAGAHGTLEADGVGGTLRVSTPQGRAESRHPAPWGPEDRSAADMARAFVARCRGQAAPDAAAMRSWEAATWWILESYRRAETFE